MAKRILLTILVCLAVAIGAPSARADRAFEDARRVFSSLEIEQRLFLQMMLTSAGHWPAVPNATYSRRLHDAVKSFQSSIGTRPTGLFTPHEIDRLFEIGAPIYDRWGLAHVRHPTRGHRLWVPTGLDLLAEETARGAFLRSRDNRFRLLFEHHPSARLERMHAELLAEMRRSGDRIDFEILRDGFFVVSSSQGRFKRYVRMHDDRSGLTGFDMSWSTDAAPIWGDRLVTIISGSLWAEMTGAPFLTVPHMPFPWEQPRMEARAPQREGKQRSREPSADSPAPRSAMSGTGFFVNDGGYLVTNAHVVEGCVQVTARADDGASDPRAIVIAEDVDMDLAIVRTVLPASGTARIRDDVRLGEAIALYGFPLSGVLARSGNFTLGHVSALAGLADDPHQLQVSAPVQAGNSGGPLLDHAGNLVGVIVGKLDGLVVALRSGDLPQNVNFAIKTEPLRRFLADNRVAFDRGVRGEPIDSADLAEMAKKMSVYLRCEPR